MGLAGGVNRRFETDNSLSLALYADSEDPALDLDARSANSLDENEDLVFSASDPEGLDADKQVGVSSEQLPQSATFEELLEVVTHMVARLNLDWPYEKQVIVHSKLDYHFLTSLPVQPPSCHLPFLPDLHTEMPRL